MQARDILFKWNISRTAAAQSPHSPGQAPVSPKKLFPPAGCFLHSHPRRHPLDSNDDFIPPDRAFLVRQSQRDWLFRKTRRHQRRALYNRCDNVAGLTYTNSGLADGTVYYFVVSATNSFGESPNSIEASAQTVSLGPALLALEISGGSMQFAWPADHIGWRLEMQTNSAGMGLGANWVTVPGSAVANQASIAINPAGGQRIFPPGLSVIRRMLLASHDRVQ